MHKPIAILLTSALFITAACNGDDTSTPLRKGEVDEAALSGGSSVSLDGTIGVVTVPFTVAVPNVPDVDLQDELEDAVTLVVTSQASGASADLAAGTIVDGSPAAAGEYSWTLNADRDTATLTFFNETPGGLTLNPGNPYMAQLTVNTNDFVERLSTLSYSVAVN